MSATGRCQETQAGKAGQEDSSFAPLHKGSRCGPGSISLSEELPGWICPGLIVQVQPSFHFLPSLSAIKLVHLLLFPTAPLPPPRPTPAKFLPDEALWASPSGFCELQRCSPATPAICRCCCPAPAHPSHVSSSWESAGIHCFPHSQLSM